MASDVTGKADGPLWKPVRLPKDKIKPQRWKPIKAKGKRTLEYEKWRDKVAKPYLDSSQGHFCAWCGTTWGLDVDHIKNRSTHPHLKMELSNVRYLCRACHQTRL